MKSTILSSPIFSPRRVRANGIRRNRVVSSTVKNSIFENHRCQPPALPARNTRKRLSSSEGFTLLEVILALAILAGAVAALGELARIGMRNAKIARDLTRAELLCESKMAEIVAGITGPDSVQSVPFEDTYSDPNDVAPWVYSIDSQTVDQDGLMAVTVTVKQDVPETSRPVGFSIVRWVPDSSLSTSESTSEETSTETTSTSSTP